jgi:uncharacterized membrane protein
MEKPSHLIRTEIIISLVLRYGVILCGSIISLGLLAREIHLGHPDASSDVLIAELMRGGLLSSFTPLHSVADFSSAIKMWEPDAIMALGLLLLIILPVARVGMTVVLFLLERDWPFFFITSFVFLILMVGL